MRPRLLKLTATTALALGLSLTTVPAFAQAGGDFEKGVAAYDTENYKEAFELWQPLADDGNVDALRNLAQLYRLGLGVQRDDTKAFELYERAADLGSPEAQVNVAFQLLTGKGVEQNREEAAKWFEKAADQGDPLAQYNLGLMYEKGVGVQKDDDLAMDLYRLAAAQGQRRAIARLDARNAAAEQVETAAAEADAEEDTDTAATEDEDAEKTAEVSDGGPVLSIQPASEKPLEFESAENTGSGDKIPAYTPEADQNGKSDDRLVINVVRTPTRKPGDKVAGAPKGNEPTPIDVQTATGEGDDGALIAYAPPPPAPSGTEQTETVAKDTKSANNTSKTLMRAPSDPVARVKMAETAYRDGNFNDAIQLLGPLANAGMPIAQFWMGRMYNRGEGVELNRAEAYSLWRSASAGGSQRAATALANLASRLSPEEISFAEQQHTASGRVR